MKNKNNRPVIPASVIRFVLNYKPKKAAARDGDQTEGRATAINAPIRENRSNHILAHREGVRK
ncbi:MAG TPA: hypothetical protein G4N96_06275 [Chloroflexi bacterium]|nr:hypothetical protein [Chloroflexota bacterium]